MTKLDEFLERIKSIEDDTEKRIQYLQEQDRNITEKIAKEMVKKDHPKMSIKEQIDYHSRNLRKAYGPFKTTGIANSCSKKLNFLKGYRENPKDAEGKMWTLGHE